MEKYSEKGVWQCPHEGFLLDTYVTDTGLTGKLRNETGAWDTVFGVGTGAKLKVVSERGNGPLHSFDLSAGSVAENSELRYAQEYV